VQDIQIDIERGADVNRTEAETAAAVGVGLAGGEDGIVGRSQRRGNCE